MTLLKNKSAVVLTILRILKGITGIFASSFLMLYFFKLSSNTLVPIASYYLTVYASVFLTFIAVVNIVKGGNKINLLRISLVLYIAYFAAIALLKEKVVDFVWIVGLLYGMGEGFYYSAFNFIESEKISNKNRISYLGVLTTLSALLSIIVPLIFGSVLEFMPYDKIAIIILVLVAGQLLFSFFIQSSSVNSKEKCNFKQFRNYLNKAENKIVKKQFISHGLHGLTICGSALGSLATLYLISVFSESFKFGVSAAILSIVGMAAGILGAKLLGKKLYKISTWVSVVASILTLVLLILFTNPATIIIYNLSSAFFNRLLEMQSDKLVLNISNRDEIKHKFKAEYFVLSELALFIGRAISYILMLMAGLFYSKIFVGIILLVLGFAFIPYVIACNDVNKYSIETEQNDIKEV